MIIEEELQKTKDEEEKQKLQMGLLTFKQSRTEKEFLSFYYKPTIWATRLGNLFVIITWLVNFVVDLIRFLRDRNDETQMALFIHRTIQVILFIIFQYIYMIPKLHKVPIIFELIAFIYSIEYVFSVTVRMIWDYQGQRPTASVVLLTIFFFRLRLTYNILIGVLGVIFFLAVSFTTAELPNLTTSPLPYVNLLYLMTVFILSALCVWVIERYFRNLFILTKELETTNKSLTTEIERSVILLENIVPIQFIKQVKISKSGFLQKYKKVVVLFSNMMNFSAHIEELTSTEVFTLLNTYFLEFDKMTELLQIEKIKSIGDSYLCISIDEENGAMRAVMMAYCMINIVLKEINEMYEKKVVMRIGIAIGPGTICLLGNHKLTFDVFGKSIEDAKQLEERSLPNSIHVNMDVALYTDELFVYEQAQDSYYLKRVKMGTPTLEKFKEHLVKLEQSKKVQQTIDEQDKVNSIYVASSDAQMEIPQKEDLIEELKTTTTKANDANERERKLEKILYKENVLRKSSEPTSPTVKKGLKMENMEFMNLPTLLTSEDKRKFVKQVKENDTLALDIKQYATFLKIKQTTAPKKPTIVKKKRDTASLTTLMKSRKDTRGFLRYMLKNHTNLPVLVGIISSLLFAIAIVVTFIIAYFVNNDMTFYYTYGVAQVASLIFMIFFTMTLAIPQLRHSMLYNIAMGIIFAILNLVFWIGIAATRDIAYYQSVTRSGLNGAMVMFGIMPGIPFIFKLFFIAIMEAAVLTLLTFTISFNFTIYFGAFLSIAIRVLFFFVFHYVLAKIYEKQSHLTIQQKALKKRYAHNLQILYSSLPPNIVSRIRKLMKHGNLDFENQQLVPIEKHIEQEFDSVGSDQSTSSLGSNQSFEHVKYQIHDEIPFMNVLILKLDTPFDDDTFVTISFVNDIFAWFDVIVEDFSLTKIKSFGTKYIVTSKSSFDIGRAALTFLEISKQLVRLYRNVDMYVNLQSDKELSYLQTDFQTGFEASNMEKTSSESDETYSSSFLYGIKIGIDCGPITAGVLGRRKYLYDIFGKTVKNASTMCKYAEHGTILMTASFTDQIRGTRLVFRRHQVEDDHELLLESYNLIS